MIRALIVKDIVQLDSIPRLVEYLKDHPFICDLCGFVNYRIPDETQFYRLIHSLDTSKLSDLLAHIDHTGAKIVDLRWGYRTHSIIDNATGFTLVEVTVPINLPDNKVAKILFKDQIILARSTILLLPRASTMAALNMSLSPATRQKSFEL